MKYALQVQGALNRLDQTLLALNRLVKEGKQTEAIQFMEQGAYDMVGELNENAVQIKYPGTTSKNLDVVIETNSPVFQQDEGKVPLKYQIVIRNASGKILPARLNIRTNK